MLNSRMLLTTNHKLFLLSAYRRKFLYLHCRMCSGQHIKHPMFQTVKHNIRIIQMTMQGVNF